MVTNPEGRRSLGAAIQRSDSLKEETAKARAAASSPLNSERKMVRLQRAHFVKAQHRLLSGIHTPIQCPAGLTRRQAVEILSNGACSD